MLEVCAAISLLRVRSQQQKAIQGTLQGAPECLEPDLGWSTTSASPQRVIGFSRPSNRLWSSQIDLKSWSVLEEMSLGYEADGLRQAKQPLHDLSFEISPALITVFFGKQAGGC